MDDHDITKIRTIGFFSHAQAGKTTLAEALLFACGATNRKGSVDSGTTVSDYSPDEIERRTSINSSVVSCNYQDYQIQIIDTPGYADFFGEALSAFRAIDGAVVMVDATAGVEVGTEKVWEHLEEQRVARIIFVNKLDKENTDLSKSMADIREGLSKKAYVMSRPYSRELVEAIAETSDSLLERYLEGQELKDAELEPALRKAVGEGKIFLVIGGAALNDQGVQELLQCVVSYLPSPLERSPLEATVANSQTKKQVEFSPQALLLAFVFKTVADPYVGQLSIFRIFSGSLLTNTGFFNVTKGSRERIGQMYRLQGKEQLPAQKASCGDIVAVAKLKDTTTSDTLGDEKEPLVLEPIIFPEPAASCAVKPKTRQDEEKISTALGRLASEDPTFRVSREEQTKELIISGLGDLHLDIMVARLKKRFNTDVETKTPKVPYHETITKNARVQGRHKKQTGGRGQFGDVWIEVEPLARGVGFEFVDKIFGGAIPRNFIPSVEKGVRHAMTEGAVAGYPIVDMRVTLVDGSFHPVDSSDIAFQIAGQLALRKAMAEAGPVLLEPVMDVEVIITDEYMGQISGDLNSRRGRIMGLEAKGKLQIIKAQVPLAEMFKYSGDLRSITGGRGNYTMKFSHYEEVPGRLAEAVISKAQQEKEEKKE